MDPDQTRPPDAAHRTTRLSYRSLRLAIVAAALLGVALAMLSHDVRHLAAVMTL